MDVRNCEVHCKIAELPVASSGLQYNTTTVLLQIHNTCKGTLTCSTEPDFYLVADSDGKHLRN